MEADCFDTFFPLKAFFEKDFLDSPLFMLDSNEILLLIKL